MGRKQKPPPLGAVWTAQCRLRVIDKSTMTWRTVGTCQDTPNAIRAAVGRLGLQGLWAFGDASGRRPVS